MTKTEITLPVGSSAEHGTCGSCKFFKRRGTDYGDFNRYMGWCIFRLPPLEYRFLLKPIDESDTSAPNQVNDSSGCDCYRHDGNTYIVQRKIEPPKTP